MNEEKKEETKKTEPESKEENLKNLSTEFKDDIAEEKRSSNSFGIVMAFVFILIIFGTLAMAIYQIFYKPERLQTKTSDEKIESRPDDSEFVATTTTTLAMTTTTTTRTSTGTKQYTVVEGDTLGAIAAKYDTTVDVLMSYNGITDETSLQIGQVIKIP